MEDSIRTIGFSCKIEPKYISDNSPEFSGYLFYTNNKLFAIYNSLILIMERKTLSEIVDGDTVRCLYHEGKTCTGFVIQGSRKSGKVIHVMPLNKNVPLEVEERKEMLKKQTITDTTK